MQTPNIKALDLTINPVHIWILKGACIPAG